MQAVSACGGTALVSDRSSSHYQPRHQLTVMASPGCVPQFDSTLKHGPHQMLLLNHAWQAWAVGLGTRQNQVPKISARRVISRSPRLPCASSGQSTPHASGVTEGTKHASLLALSCTQSFCLCVFTRGVDLARCRESAGKRQGAFQRLYQLVPSLGSPAYPDFP